MKKLTKLAAMLLCTVIALGSTSCGNTSRFFDRDGGKFGYESKTEADRYEDDKELTAPEMSSDLAYADESPAEESSMASTSVSTSTSFGTKYYPYCYGVPDFGKLIGKEPVYEDEDIVDDIYSYAYYTNFDSGAVTEYTELLKEEGFYFATSWETDDGDTVYALISDDSEFIIALSVLTSTSTFNVMITKADD